MKSILLIGLGRFGRHVAEKLYELNHQVMAVDKMEDRVEAVLPYVTNGEIEIPDNLVGKTIGQVDIRKKFNINIMALKRKGSLDMAIRPDTMLDRDVTMLVLGESKDIQKCFKI